MTLNEAKAAWCENQDKKIIRESNRHGCVDVWFTVNPHNVLLVHKWVPYGNGYISSGVAPFQQSEHIDWILYP